MHAGTTAWCVVSLNFMQFSSFWEEGRQAASKIDETEQLCEVVTAQALSFGCQPECAYCVDQQSAAPMF